MRKSLVFATFLYILIINQCICNDLYSDKVKKYDSETFKTNIGGSIPHFISFFAPWCGYCKRLKPVWDELAEKYNIDSSNQKLVIAKVDCTSETPLCAEENISGYPSLIFYPAGEKKGIKFQGKRDVVGLEEFIAENIVRISKDETVPPSVKIPETSSMELTDETFHNIVDYGLHFVKFYAPWCGHCQKMAGAWEELAKNSQQDKSITISSVDCTKHERACQEFEVKGFPTLLWIVDGKKVEKYDGARNFEEFKQFIVNMKAAHKERLENEEGRIPDAVENVPDLVVELTEANFENAIRNGFTFVKFYTPWCGHSKKLAPIWNNLAIKFAPEGDVTLAKVDCVNNEELCAQYKIVGYPSLLLFHNGEHITEYSGPRKLEQLYTFILDYLHHTEL